MPFDDLRSQSTKGAAARCEPLKHVVAFVFALKRSLDAGELSLKATDAVQEVPFAANGVGHES